MKKTDKKLIMFIGKTHSGKTTFAKALEKENQNLIILEADPVALFMKEHFPKLSENDDKHHESTFKNISLKYKTFLVFVEFAMSLNRPIVLSNSNMWKKGREFIFKLCKKFDYKIIGVYFDYLENLLFERVKISNRNTAVLRRSKDFSELIINQRSRMEPPNKKDFDKFFVIKSENDLVKTKNELLKIID